MQLCPPIPEHPGSKQHRTLGRRGGKLNLWAVELANLSLLCDNTSRSYLCLLDTSAICRPSIWYTSQPGNPQWGFGFQIPGFHSILSALHPWCTSPRLTNWNHRRPAVEEDYKILQVYGRIRQSCFAMLCLSQIPGLILSGDPTK